MTTEEHLKNIIKILQYNRHEEVVWKMAMDYCLYYELVDGDKPDEYSVLKFQEALVGHE